MSEPVEIRTKWDRFGDVATTPDLQPPLTSTHCLGPRTAAEQLARKIFPDGFKLKFMGRGHYQATPQPKKGAQS